MFTPEEIKQRREARKQARKEAKEQAEIAEMRNQKAVDRLTITIEGKRSRTWGMNPSAIGHVAYKDGTFGQVGPFTCSGCGYDKESTVIAQIFNAVLRYKLFLKHKDGSPYGMYYYGGNVSKDGYAPGYNGGVGTSCYYRIAEFIGGTFAPVASGKTFNVFEYTDNAK